MGAAVSLVFGTFLSILSDVIGPKRICMTFCFLHVFAAIWKIVTMHPSGWITSILLGLASSVFPVCFETWMVTEHGKIAFARLSLPLRARQEVLEQVMGPGTKGRERGQGRVAKPPKSKITIADLERAREEIADQVRQGVQSQVVQAVAEALRLYREGIQQIPPTQGTGSQQSPSTEEDHELSRTSR